MVCSPEKIRTPDAKSEEQTWLRKKTESRCMSKLRFWGKLIVSLAGCAILAWWMDWKQTIDILTKADGYRLLLAFAIIHLDRAFMAYKWTLLLRGLGVTASRITALQAYYVSSFWSTFLPASVGGDIVRAGWLIGKGHRSTRIISSVIIERLLGASALAVVSLGSMFLLTFRTNLSFPVVFTTIGLLLAEAAICFIAIFSHSLHAALMKAIMRLPFTPLRNALDKMDVAALTFTKTSGPLVIFFILSLVEQAFPILGTYILARAFAIDLSLGWAVIGVPLLMAVSRLPISINGWGIQEGAFVFIFSAAGLPLSGAVLVSLANRVLLILAALPGAVWTMSVARGERTLHVATSNSSSG